MVPTRLVPAGCDEPPREGRRTMDPQAQGTCVPWWHPQRWSCSPRGGNWGGEPPSHDEGFGGGGDGGDGGGFGVRRPLRFLAYKLELDDRQVSELARILNELKTERA